MSLDSKLEMLPDAAAVMTLTGRLTLGTSLMMLNAQLDRAIEDGIVHLVMDLTAMDYCDSAGLGMIVNTNGLLKKKGGSLRLCGVDKRVLELLQMTNIDSLISIDADRAASLAAIGK